MEKETKNIPKTDEEVVEALSFQLGASGIYRIFRERDGMEVFEAYMATLDFIIEIEKKTK